MIDQTPSGLRDDDEQMYSVRIKHVHLYVPGCTLLVARVLYHACERGIEVPRGVLLLIVIIVKPARYATCGYPRRVPNPEPTENWVGVVRP